MDIEAILGCVLIVESAIYFGLYFTVKKATKDVLIDGDQCWDSDSFQVTDETKKIIIYDIFDFKLFVDY